MSIPESTRCHNSEGAHIIVFIVVRFVVLGLFCLLDVYVGSSVLTVSAHVLSLHWVESTAQ
jgi:hypothetical protein